MLGTLAVIFSLSQGTLTHVILVSDHRLEPTEIQLISDAKDPESVLGSKHYKVKKEGDTLIARVPDLYLLESTADRIAATREITTAMRQKRQILRIGDLSPSAQRGVHYLAGAHWSEGQHAVLTRPETRFALTSTLSTWCVIDGHTLPLWETTSGPLVKDCLNSPPTEKDFEAYKKIPKPGQNRLTILQFSFIRPKASDEVITMCGDESQQISGELKAQNKQIVDLRTGLSTSSPLQGKYRKGDRIASYSGLDEKFEANAKQNYKAYGFESLTQVINGLKTALIGGSSATISLGLNIADDHGNLISGSTFDITMSRYP
jgi:hypothetical protein